MAKSPHNPRAVRLVMRGAADVSTDTASGATHTVDLNDGNIHHVTLTANCTLTFTAPDDLASTDGARFDLFLKQDGTGSRTVTWPASVEWSGGTAPTLTTTAGVTDWIRFTTPDGGTNWFGEQVALNYNEA